MCSDEVLPTTYDPDGVGCAQLLGINCLRIPFSFQTLFNVAPGSKAGTCTPVSDADIRANVIPPGVTVPASAQLPPQVLTCTSCSVT